MTALSVKSAAAELEVSQDTIRAAINSQSLPAHRVGRLIRIHHDDLMEWFRGQPRVGSPEDREAS